MEFYYLSSENKGADQLRSYGEADLQLCFRICRLFSDSVAHIIKFNIFVEDVSSELLLMALHYLSQFCLSTLKALEYMFIAYKNIKLRGSAEL